MKLGKGFREIHFNAVQVKKLTNSGRKWSKYGYPNEIQENTDCLRKGVSLWKLQFTKIKKENRWSIYTLIQIEMADLDISKENWNEIFDAIKDLVDLCAMQAEEIHFTNILNLQYLNFSIKRQILIYWSWYQLFILGFLLSCTGHLGYHETSFAPESPCINNSNSMNKALVIRSCIQKRIWNMFWLKNNLTM